MKIIQQQNGILYKRRMINLIQKVDRELHSRLKEIDEKVESLKRTNIRISCFSEFKNHEEFNNQILMWSHYAEDHKGFLC